MVSKRLVSVQTDCGGTVVGVDPGERCMSQRDQEGR